MGTGGAEVWAHDGRREGAEWADSGQTSGRCIQIQENVRHVDDYTTILENEDVCWYTPNALPFLRAIVLPSEQTLHEAGRIPDIAHCGLNAFAGNLQKRMTGSVETSRKHTHPIQSRTRAEALVRLAWRIRYTSIVDAVCINHTYRIGGLESRRSAIANAHEAGTHHSRIRRRLDTA